MHSSLPTTTCCFLLSHGCRGPQGTAVSVACGSAAEQLAQLPSQSAGPREPGPTLSPEVPTLCLPSPSPTSIAALPGHRAFSYPHRGPQNVRVVGTGQNAPALPVFTPSPHPPALSLVIELPDLGCFPLPCTFHECPESSQDLCYCVSCSQNSAQAACFLYNSLL